MTRRPKLWLVVASVFTLINVGGAVFAAQGGLPGELPHVLAHVGLALIGAFFVWRLARRVRQQDVARQLPDERIEHLQQSVDAMAIGVERLGEAQRFITKLAAEQSEPPRPKADPMARRLKDEL